MEDSHDDKMEEDSHDDKMEGELEDHKGLVTSSETSTFST